MAISHGSDKKKAPTIEPFVIVSIELILGELVNIFHFLIFSTC
jgi:hypothetical protein